jgi:hypothetical protein
MATPESTESNPWRNFGLSAGLGGLGTGFAQKFMGDYRNPMKSAMPYLNQAENMLPKYFEPYINAGKEAIPGLQEQYKNLLNDPEALMNHIAGNYKESPGYKFQLGQAEQGINSAAAAGGMLGSPSHQLQAGEMATNLANQDFYNYLQNALGSAQTQYGRGLTGLEGMAGRGQQASTDLGENLASILGTKGGLAYQGAQEENKRKGDTLGGIFGAASSLLPFIF